MISFEHISHFVLVLLMSVDFEHIIVHWVVFFHYKYQRFMFNMHWESSYFSVKFLIFNFLDFFSEV